jgi:hypothetical protein
MKDLNFLLIAGNQMILKMPELLFRLFMDLQSMQHDMKDLQILQQKRDL